MNVSFSRLALAAGLALTASTTLADDNIVVTELATGLNHPWGMVFLPDQSLLLTERSGNIRHYRNGQLSAPLAGVPEVVASYQGGMLDITVDPDFASNNTIYFCFSRAGEGGSSSTVAKATLGKDAIDNVKVIFEAAPKVDNGFHFGCRLAFDGEKNLYVSLGDRGSFKEEAQNTDNHFGTLLRLRRDGSVPDDNPFVNGKAPEIYSYGHRNIQGLTVHPTTGRVWAMEHGPKGGDEVNLIGKGLNYGWPVISYGINYDDTIITELTAKEGMQQPVLYWNPSIAPSGMVFYSGDAFPEWQGDLLVGALKFTHLRRIRMQADVPGEQIEYLRDRKERIRDVEVGPDGLIYLLTDADDGKLLQVSPKK